MKKLLILFLITGTISAQVPLSTTPKYIDKNKVRGSVNTVNNHFWNLSGNQSFGYEVPIGKNTQAQAANSMWIGGFDQAGILHMAANTYCQKGRDFWAGPLDTTNIGVYTASNTAVYNKLWKVDCNDIANFITAYNNGSVTANTYTVPNDLLTYPGRGISKFTRSMEPFYDANTNGIYDPKVGGDYPLIKGHQQILSIYNDTLGKHAETGASAMGIEVHEKIYAYSDPLLPDSMQAVNYSIFFHYTIINRSLRNYYNVYIGDWSEVDLGNGNDDFIGSDTINNFTYAYNGDNNDETYSGINGYGSSPPVVSHAILKTNCMDGIDNNGDGIIDEPGEQFRMNRSMYFNNNIGSFPIATTNPNSPLDYYHLMSGTWKGGVPLTYGGTGYGGTVPTHYVYPGNPALNSGWTEANAGNQPGNRRIFTTSGPFDLPTHARIEWGFVIVFSQDTTPNVNTITQFNTRVQRDVRNVRYYDQMHQNAQCAPPITLGVPQNAILTNAFSIWPNPANDKLYIKQNEKSDAVKVKLKDLSGRTIIDTVLQDDTIDLSSTDKGIYLLELSTSGKTTVHKIIRN